MTIGDSVTIIVGHVFDGCSSLAKIIVPEGTKEYYVKLFKDADMSVLGKKIIEGNLESNQSVNLQIGDLEIAETTIVET